MRPTELRNEPTDARLSTPSAQLAGDLFDEVIAPLARAVSGDRCEPVRGGAGRESGAASFFVRFGVSRMTPRDFEFPGGGTGEGLVDALARHWAAEGATGLAAAIPRLRQLVESLRDEVGTVDGSVDIFCYTLF